MKQLFLSLVFLFPFFISAQDTQHGNLTIFSDKGESFTVFLNGEKKNATPQSKVRIENLTQLSYQVKIIYADAARTTVSRSNVYISDGDDQLMDVAYRISKTGNNTAKLRFYSMNRVKQNNLATLPEGSSLITRNPTAGSLHIFSEEKDLFFLYLNGIKLNETPQDNIRVANLRGMNYDVKIVFNEASLPAVSKSNLYITDRDDVLMDVSYKITRAASSPKLSFFSMNPVKVMEVVPEGMFLVEASDEVEKKAPVIANNVTVSDKVNEPAVTKISETNVNTTEKKNSAKVNQAAKKPIPNNVAAKTSTKKLPPITAANTQKSTEVKKEAPMAISIKEPSDWVCENEWPMWKLEYTNAKKSITDAKTDILKLAAAKLLVSKNCLNCEQVAEIGALFLKDEAKLEFAKFAFNHTIDIKNYFKIARIFSSNKSKDAFTQFIGG